MLSIEPAQQPRGDQSVTQSRNLRAPGGRHGFAPAYLNLQTGAMVHSTFSNGVEAPVHLLEGLPGDWLDSPATAGSQPVLKEGIIPGYIRDQTFFTREQACAIAAREHAERMAGSAYYDAF